MQAYITPISSLDKSWKVVSNNDIVPEIIQNRLIFWRDTFRTAQFDIGDVANVLCDESARTGLPVTQQRIYDAVGSFCGKTGRTVRYYAETARFYPKEVREEYDMIPFSHFVLARAWGELWRNVLDYSAAHPQMSEEGLRYQFHVSNDVKDENASPQAFSDYENSDFNEILEDDNSQKTDQPAHINTTKANMAISALSSLIDQINKLFSSMSLQEETKRKIALIEEGIREVIPEIMKQIEDK